jgi:hypothetical protein
MNSWHSYPKIYALGHRALTDLLSNPVIVEEKVDGSQFSFGWFSDCEYHDGFRARSKGAELNLDSPEKMFTEAVNYILGLSLKDGWTYRCEYLKKPKHNALAYDRVPSNHLILFDINVEEEGYLSWDEKAEEAARLNIDIIPCFHNGELKDIDLFRELLDTTSCLGGQKIEGVVIKNYNRFGFDGKALMGKYVSEKFKEVHSQEWKKENPKSGDVLQNLILEYGTPERWQKALIHLEERGLIENSPRDIGLLIKEVWPDIEIECKDEIIIKFYKWLSPHLARGVTRGLADWYKNKLMEKQFDD